MPDNSERSRYHRRIEQILQSAGINFMSEEPFPPYKVDILLPAAWAAIEVDGPFHHSRHDKSRDEYLREHYKLPVLRIKIKTISRRSKIEDAISQFYNDNLKDAQERKATWLQTQP